MTCTEAPSVPTSVNASVADLSAVTVSWTAASAPAGCSVTYSVLRAGQAIAAGLMAASYTDTTTAAQAGYSYTVVAVDEFGSSAPSAKADMTCTTNSDLGLSPYVLQNSSYNNSDLGDAYRVTNFTMCSSLSGGIDGTVNAQWAWNWPFVDYDTVRATPTIVYGFKPWDPGSTTPDLPAHLSDVESLTVDADVTQTVGENASAQFGVIAYLTDSDQKAQGESVLKIRTHFYVYRNVYSVDLISATVKQISIDGVSWDLALYQNSDGSNLVMYSPSADAAKSVTSLHLDLAHFLADALSRGAIDSSSWLASVETINILWQGTGSTTLTNYKVQFQAKQ